MFQQGLAIAFLTAAVAAIAWAQSTCDDSAWQSDDGVCEVGASEVGASLLQGRSIVDNGGPQGPNGPKGPEGQRMSDKGPKGRGAKMRERRRKKKDRIMTSFKNTSVRKCRIDTQQNKLDQEVPKLPPALKLAEDALPDDVLNETGKRVLKRLRAVPEEIKNASSTYEKAKLKFKDTEGKWRAFLDDRRSSSRFSNMSLIQTEDTLTTLDIFNIDDALAFFLASQEAVDSSLQDAQLAYTHAYATLAMGSEVIDVLIPQLQSHVPAGKFDSDFTSSSKVLPPLVNLQETVHTLLLTVAGTVESFTG